MNVWELEKGNLVKRYMAQKQMKKWFHAILLALKKYFMSGIKFSILWILL